MMLSETTIQAIRNVPIKDVLDHYLSFKRAGSQFVALCPFHSERTPSFYIHRRKNIYKCFGCDAGGDAIKFIMEYEGKSFGEAVEHIAGMAGIPLESVPTVPLSHFKKWDTSPKEVEPVAFDHLPFSLLERSVIECTKCDLFPFLERLFTKQVAVRLCEDYLIGATKNGLTAFWQVDSEGQVCQVRVIHYPDPLTGKRSRDTNPFLAGRLILGEDASFRQCFFGEWLLNSDKAKPVAIVESEKSAVVASVFFPQFIWIATGGKYGCRWYEKAVCSVLAGRTVVLFPDLGMYERWSELGEAVGRLAPCKVVVSDILEANATDQQKADGLDIADYLLKTDSTGLALTDEGYPVLWDLCEPYL